MRYNNHNYQFCKYLDHKYIDKLPEIRHNINCSPPYIALLPIVQSDTNIIDMFLHMYCMFLLSNISSQKATKYNII